MAMRAISQSSFDAAAERWETVMASTSGDLKAMALDMLLVTDTLDQNSQLRRIVTDPAADPEAKATLIQNVFGGKVHEDVLDLAKGLARSHWSDEDDLAATIGRLAAFAVMADAEKNGQLVQMADEMFAVEQFLTKERRLRDSFSDRNKSPEQRVRLVEDVFGGKVSEYTLMMLRRMVAARRHPGVISSLRTHTRLAAERRDRKVAVVTTALPLSSAQQERMERVLADRYGTNVQVHVRIDPEIVGGMRIVVGDDIVDGTISSRLAALQRDLTD
ncbi:MAG TPA: F0F1 ATP synthase subunit delta [Actinomycetales bacterium]|nr:F0F1 ATP synthase subunit delta [Actinomycetales bacterium]